MTLFSDPAEGVSRQNTANGPHIVGVGGVDGLTVEMGDKHLQLHAAAMEEAQTPQEKAARYAANLKTYEGAAQPRSAVDVPGDAARHRMKNWEIIADNLSKAGFSLGWVEAVDLEGRTIWITRP